MKVFLSSTAEDLEAYRRVADDTILRLAQQSIAMERFGPLPDTPVEECERLASESDVVVCIVAHRYGYIPEKGRGSITRREVEAAHKAGKDVLAWIVTDDYPWPEKKEQDLLADPNVLADQAKTNEVAKGVAGLIDFKAWLRTTFTPETFTTPDDLGKKIAVALANYFAGQTAAPVPRARISIARLPTTSAELFGREDELQILDDAWSNPTTNIVSFIAWGGVGKTALVNHWLKRRMTRDNYRGAERVYGWSFFSQGASDRAASADLFIDQALRWFDDVDPTLGSPWDKGERLARYIRESRTLLILDGLEPLQHPPGFQEGRLKDAAIQALLVELAAQQSGLCVISTRERIGDLSEFQDSSVIQHDLEELSPQAGAQVLRSLKVKGDEAELEETARELSGHAFSLTLLGSYLDEALEGDIRRRKEIENLFDDTRYGYAAQKVISTYEKWLGEGRELAILRLLGLFDRPADRVSLEVLRERPAIAGLTEPLQSFKAREWNQAVAKLRRIKLLDQMAPDDPGTLAAHPLVREYFKQQLKRENIHAWRKANNRLYEHLRKTAKDYPATVEEMSPLYAAVAHGCSAQRYQEVLTDVYQRRIQRGTRYFNINQLGATSIQLATLSNFFEILWERPVQALADLDKAYVLNDASGCLRSLGRLEEAIQPAHIALDIATKKTKWDDATVIACNLTDLYVTTGNLRQALIFARKSVELGDRTDEWRLHSQSRAILAHVMHQMGNSQNAYANFREAEEIQQRHESQVPILYSLAGFQYCDWILSQGDSDAVKTRACKAIELTGPNLGPASYGLDNLTLGRVSLFKMRQGETSHFLDANEYLNRAILELRRTGVRDLLPFGLLGRAEMFRLKGDFDNAVRDLAETYHIAVRSGMGLHLTDYHLESARLQLTWASKEKAREHLSEAKKMVDRMGYHRRDKELAELELQLA